MTTYSYKHIFIYGFAIFSMFFGSGNLVFPLQVGMEAGSYWFLGFLGLFLTGIILPFLGLFVIKLHKGNYTDFFQEGGVAARLLLPLFTLSLLGAFGVVPRCITVAHGGIASVFPNLSLVTFSILFSIACFVICLKDQIMIAILGKWMTPILLIALVLLIGWGAFHVSDFPLDAHINAQPETVFTHGFLKGYQTMDLFAAFFFSSLIFKEIQREMHVDTPTKTIIRAALKPSVFGAFLLSCIYLGFVFLSARYRPITQGVSPELILPTIASYVLGDHAALFIGIIMIFSCMTTAVALNNIYARYWCDLLKVKNKNAFHVILFLTTSISFLISLLDFQGIAGFLEPALKLSYPSVIALTVMSIFIKDRMMLKKIIFYGTLCVTLILTFWR